MAILLLLALQFLGYVFDAVWHGLLFPGVEPATPREMVRHLATVHLPLYIGALSVLVSTTRAFLRQRPRSTSLSFAVAGAVVSVGAEVWHAVAHLRMDTHAGPVAGTLSALGFLVVVIAIALSRRHWRRRSSDTTTDERAA